MENSQKYGDDTPASAITDLDSSRNSSISTALGVCRKRSLSQSSDSDFHEESSGIPSPSYQAHSETDIKQTNTRLAKKQRRGLIEKRRRDRINNSLNELKSLIPTACERQVSTKLEKSEVLHLAVEHIRSLQSKDYVTAMDYRAIGFQECISEVAQYLTTSIGIAPSDPLHCRLIHHLHQQVSNEWKAAMCMYDQPNTDHYYHVPYKHEPHSPVYPTPVDKQTGSSAASYTTSCPQPYESGHQPINYCYSQNSR